MKIKNRFLTTAILISAILFINFPLFAAPKKTEAELIQMLRSGNAEKMNDALDRLPHWYPQSTNAIEIIKGILRSNEVITVTYVTITKRGTYETNATTKSWPPHFLARMAARSLGNYHANLNDEDLQQIYQLLKSQDTETVMDGLKALRGLNVPQAQPEILPLLADENDHIVRDTCRTLAVLGDTNAIPFIEPLLKRPRMDVRQDAQEAIKTLRAKR